VAVRPVKAESTSVVTMKETAQVRLDTDGANAEAGKEHLGKDGQNGLRFTAYLSKDVTLDEDTYAGIFVARGDVKVEDMKNLTPDNEDVINVKAEKFDIANNDPVLGRAFNAVIYAIPVEAYTQDLTAMAYVCDNGEYSYSEKVCTRSLVEVASASIAYDSLSADDVALLQKYVQAVNPVVSVGGTQLVAGGSVDVEMVGGEVLPITVEPACVAFTAETTKNSFVKIEDNQISATKAVNSVQTVVVKMAGNEYVVNVTIKPWTDPTLAENVIVDFNTPNSLFSIVDKENVYNAITWYDAESAKAHGADSGVVGIAANAFGKDVVVNLPKPVKIGEIGGIYVKIKISASASAKNFYLGINNVGKPIYTNWHPNQPVGTFDGEWTTLKMYRGDMLYHDGSRTLDTEITNIVLSPWSGDVKPYYIDEIGIIPLTEDANIEKNVAIDFDEEASIYSNIVTENGILTHLTGEEAEAIGAKGGAVKIEEQHPYEFTRVYFDKPISKNNLSQLYITLMHNTPNWTYLYLSFPTKDGTDYQGKYAAQWTKEKWDGGIPHTTNQMYTIIFDVVDFMNNTMWSSVADEIEYVEFRALNTGVWYIDEIGNIPNSATNDNLLSSFEIEGFNYYYGAVRCTGAEAKVVKPGDSDYPTETGATTNLFKIDIPNDPLDSEMEILADKLVKATSVAKFIVKIWVPEWAPYTSHSRVYFKFNRAVSNGWYNWEMDNLALGYTRGQWNTYEIPVNLTGEKCEYVYSMYLWKHYWPQDDGTGKNTIEGQPAWYIAPIEYVLKQA
jgi:hypothetical protein